LIEFIDDNGVVFKLAAGSQGIVLIFGLGLILLMPMLLKVARKFDCHRDIMALRSLVPTRDQDDKRFAPTNKIDGVSGTVVDP